MNTSRLHRSPRGTRGTRPNTVKSLPAALTATLCAGLVTIALHAPVAVASEVERADVQSPNDKTSSLYPGSSYLEYAPHSSSPLSSDIARGVIRAPGGSSDLVPHNAIVLPPELVPVGPTGPTPPRTVDDFLSAGAVISDYLGDDFSVRNWMSLMSPERRTMMSKVIHQLHSPVAGPPLDDGSGTLIVVLGGGLNSDGTVPPAVCSRLEKGPELAHQHPEATVLLSGGRTPSGFVEAESMREWLKEQGLDPNRIVVEGRSWSTVSNAWQSRRVADAFGLNYSRGVTVVTNDFHLHRGVTDFTITFGDKAPVYGAHGGSPIAWNAEEQRKKAYRDAIMSFIAPYAIIADGAIPFGSEVARPF